MYQPSPHKALRLPRNRRVVGLYVLGAVLLAGIMLGRATPLPSLSWHTARTLLGLVTGAVVLGGLFWGIETLWPEDELQPRWSTESKTSGAFLLLNAGVTARVAAVAVLVTTAALTVLHVPRLPETWVTTQPLWAQLIEVATIKDFLGYWNHRLFHTVPALWRFHAVHHAAEDVNWLSAAREHPVESIASKINTMVPLFLLGFSGQVLAPYVGFWAAYTLFLHANVTWSYGPFRWLLTSPAFHRWHHSSDDAAIDKNFSALLPLWDWAFGTAYFPKGQHSEKYGLAGGEQMPEGVAAQIAYGFQKPTPAPSDTVPASADLAARRVY